MHDLKNIKFEPGFKTGTIAIPSSKSISHRALICAALAKEQSYIYRVDRSDDINVTIGALREMGAVIEILEDKITVENNNQKLKNPDSELFINCGESGSTLRFLIPVAAALGIRAAFTGKEALKKRPVDLYADLFKDKNAEATLYGGEILMKISGKLSAGKFYIPGNITSQFITGMLFALPILDGDSEIILTSPLQSAPYADMTADVLNSFGITVHKITNGYYINGRQHYRNATCIIEGDFTQAAYFACAAAINGDITIKRLNPKSMQGDYRIIDILCEFGAKVYFEGNVLRAVKGENLKGIKIDASDIPDLIPVLAVVASYAQGETVIYNAERLRLKESDRIKSICEMLKSIGSNVKETEDGLIIFGSNGEKLPGGSVKSYGDHRIAMSAAIAGIGTKNGVTLDEMDCVNKSYPLFLKDFTGLD